MSAAGSAAISTGPSIVSPRTSLAGFVAVPTATGVLADGLGGQAALLLASVALVAVVQWALTVRHRRRRCLRASVTVVRSGG